MHKILLVEDDPVIRQMVKKMLEQWGFQVVAVEDFMDVLTVFVREEPHLVLMDIGLPLFNGYHWCQEIRKISTVPIMFLSSRDQSMDIVMAINMGADDYVTKPFDLEEVLARIESNLRRAALSAKPDRRLRCGELLLDEEKNTAFIKDAELSLTAKEYRILELLLQYPDKIFSKANLFESVWDCEYLSEDNTLNVHISNLRNKLKALSPDEEYIDTVWGIGYRLHRS